MIELGTDPFLDAVGNLTLINYSNSTDIALSYDAVNRLTNMTDAVGTTRFTYTAFGALLSEDGPWADDTVSYAHTSTRQRQSLSLAQPNAAAWAQTYAYDAARRLTNTTSPAGAFGYAYKAAQFRTPTNETVYLSAGAGMIERLSLPSGAYITNEFDWLARLASTTLRNSSHSTLNSHSYQLNDAHQRTKQTRTAGDFVDYTYDPIGQLKTALGMELSGTTNRLQEQFRYTYDAAGNLSNRVANVLTNVFNVNSLNELTTVARTTNFTLAGFTTMSASSVTVNGASATRYADHTFAKENLALVDGNNTFTAVATDSNGRGDTNAVTLSLPASISFAYDLNGNMITNGARVMEYDDENQLSRITEAGVFKSEFTYDGKLRRRIRKEYEWRNGAWVKTNEVRYVYDGNLPIQDRHEFNLPVKSFTRGLDLSGSLEGAGGIGGLLAFSDHTLGAVFHIDFHADGNGNVTCLVDRNQEVQGRYLFDPFGNTLAASGPIAELNLYRFSSKEWHAQSGLVYYLYRYYAPELQRWVNADPIAEEGGLNLHAFVSNDPMQNVDPFGLLTREDCFNKCMKEQVGDFKAFCAVGASYGAAALGSIKHKGRPIAATVARWLWFQALRGAGASVPVAVGGRVVVGQNAAAAARVAAVGAAFLAGYGAGSVAICFNLCYSSSGSNLPRPMVYRNQVHSVTITLPTPTGKVR